MPDVLQHVMGRGIDGYDIFQDERDREAFLERLAGVVEWAHADLLAWCLMSNHFPESVSPPGWDPFGSEPGRGSGRQSVVPGFVVSPQAGLAVDL